MSTNLSKIKRDKMIKFLEELKKTHTDDSSIRALKATGYKLAVTVEGGRVQPGANKYQLPRVRVADGNSLQYFIKCVE